MVTTIKQKTIHLTSLRCLLIQLKHIDHDRPLEEEIIQQYGLQEVNATKTEVGFILEYAKTLLIFDGYDEYQEGTNSAIDTRIRASKGNQFVIITSRPDHMPKKYKQKMDEIQLKGFSKSAIRICAKNYLDREGQSKKSEKFLQKAKDNGIKDILKIPLLLLMLCVIFIETKTLPSNKTKMTEELIQIYMKRAEEKGKQIEDETKMLQDLAKLSYEASTRQLDKKGLFSSTRQLHKNRLFINKVCPKFTKIRREIALIRS